MEFAVRSSMPPTPDEYVRENIEPTLTKGLAELCRARPSNPCTWLAEWLQANKPPPPKRAAPEPKPEPLSAEALAAATARYSTTADLRKLLTYDEERGGIPIRLLSARWLLTYFQAEGNETARLEHRQWLEREHPEAFVSGEALERVLAELEERTVKYTWGKGKVYEHEEEAHGSFYMSKVESGEWRVVTQNKGGNDRPLEIGFPSAMALSHMWLDKSHPDPNARNLRDMWLPAIEWLYSERVKQLVSYDKYGRESRHKDADGTPLSDEAVLAAADFGLFVDLSSMCQKENDRRTEVEDGLFRHSLGSLDVVYAHKGLMSLLSTRVPEGVEVDRSYGERHSSLTPNSLHSPAHLTFPNRGSRLDEL